MDIVLKKATTKSAMAALAADALEARLYVSRWQLILELKDIKRAIQFEKCVMSIVVAYIDEVPVGVCVSRKWKNRAPSIMTFVRKKHRRRGIGTKLVKKVMGRKKKFTYCYGLKVAAPFFDQFSDAVNDF